MKIPDMIRKAMRNILLAAGVLILAVSCASNKHNNNNDMTPERLTYFSFDHHNSMAMFYGEKYNVSTMDDGRIHVVIDEGFPEEKELPPSSTSCSPS